MLFISLEDARQKETAARAVSGSFEPRRNPRTLSSAQASALTQRHRKCRLPIPGTGKSLDPRRAPRLQYLTQSLAQKAILPGWLAAQELSPSEPAMWVQPARTGRGPFAFEEAYFRELNPCLALSTNLS
jgi:hypothetical protein